MKKRLAILAMIFTFAFGTVNVRAEDIVGNYFDEIVEMVENDDDRCILPKGITIGFVKEIIDDIYDRNIIDYMSVVKEDKETKVSYIELYVMNCHINKKEGWIETYNPRMYVNSGAGWSLVKNEEIKDE